MKGHIHQSLHGYERGHRLLAGSIELPQDAARKMLYLSDLSGTNRSEGFEHYITAYPLPEVSMFALGHTWEAPEMQRPGCVFTHTLLMSYSDLAQISDLSVLLSCFQRPSKGLAGQDYRTTLSVPTSYQARKLDNRKVCRLLSALYEHDEQNIVIASDRSDEWLAEIFAVWSQMWPRIRRNFTFSTGSLGPRTLDGEPLTLQVIPIRWQSRMQRDFSNALWIQEDIAPQSTSGWLRRLAEDCASNELTELRSFLRSHAADLPPHRASMPLLGQFWDWQKLPGEKQTEAKRVADLLLATAEAFPSPQDAPRLKRELLGPGVRHREQEVALLCALGTTSAAQAFDPVALGGRERVLALWRSERIVAEGLVFTLLGTERNAIGDHMLDAISDELTPTDVVRLTTDHPGLLHRWLPSHPEWLTQPSLWRQPESQQRHMLEWVAQHQLHLAKELPEILDAIVRFGSPVLAADAIRLFGPLIIDNLLTLLETGKLLWPLPTPWLDILRQNQTQALHWLTRSQRPSTVIAALMPLLSPSALRENDVLLRAQGTNLLAAAEQSDSSARLILHAIRCYLGLSSQHVHGYEFLHKSFSVTYNSLHSVSLPGNWKEYILANIPRMKKLRPTHTEDKLLIALWSHFAEDQWDLCYLFSILSEKNIMTQFVGFLKYSDESSALKRLRRYGKRNPEKLTSDQHDILNSLSLKEWIQKTLSGASYEED